MGGNLRAGFSGLRIEVGMSADIELRQNQSINLARLAAQRQLYASGKVWHKAQLVLSVPVVVLVAFIALAMDKGWLGLPRWDVGWLVGATGVLITLVDIVILAPLIERRKALAAKIQQLFDCDVLKLPWRGVVFGVKPDNEAVAYWSGKYRMESAGPLLNWYSTAVDTLPAPVARLICQRTNCWWDMTVRERFNAMILCLGLLLLALLTLFAPVQDITLRVLLGQILAPSLPFVVVSSKLYLDNRDAIERLRQMKEAIESVWERLLREDVPEAELTTFSEMAQVAIYVNRRNNPLIFDRVYEHLRDANERAMNKSAEEYVEEYRSAKRTRRGTNA